VNHWHMACCVNLIHHFIFSTWNNVYWISVN
jgi:hypothetical protein